MASSANQWGDDAIQQGFWTNWSQGAVMGTKLTLPAPGALMIAAALVIFITLVFERLWRITCFFVHRYLSGGGYQDGLYHQRQALLRNSGNPFSLIKTLLRAAWAWRYIANHTLTRQLPLIILASLEICGYILACLYSSRMVIFGDEALLHNSECGFISTSPQDSVKIQAFSAAQHRTSVASWEQYVQDCYAGPEGSSQLCEEYVTPNIGSQVITGVDCPFADVQLCQSPQDIVRVESGLIDSNDHLGINNPEEDRIQYRRALTCSPIQTTPGVYTQTRKGDGSKLENPRAIYTDFLYSTEDGDKAVTFAAPTATKLMRDKAPGYTLAMRSDLANDNSDSTFIARSELAPLTSDVHLFLLSKSVEYTENFDGGWFGPLKKHNGHWLPDGPSVVACAEQHEFCNMNKDVCTGWGGINEIGELTTLLNPDEPSRSSSIFPNVADHTIYATRDSLHTSLLQNATLTLLRGAIDQTSLSRLVPALGSSALLASESFAPNSPVSAPLASNQTALEMQRWNNMVLAGLQLSMTARVRAQEPPSPDARLSFGSDGLTKALCGQQKVHAANFASISVFAMALIVLLGCAVIAFSWLVERTTWAVMESRFFIRDSSSRREWQGLSVLHLLAQAYEANGDHGNWVGAQEGNGIPVTEKGDAIGLPFDTQDDLMWTDPAFMNQVVNDDRTERWTVGRNSHGARAIFKRRPTFLGSQRRPTVEQQKALSGMPMGLPQDSVGLAIGHPSEEYDSSPTQSAAREPDNAMSTGRQNPSWMQRTAAPPPINTGPHMMHSTRFQQEQQARKRSSVTRLYEVPPSPPSKFDYNNLHPGNADLTWSNQNTASASDTRRDRMNSNHSVQVSPGGHTLSGQTIYPAINVNDSNLTTARGALVDDGYTIPTYYEQGPPDRADDQLGPYRKMSSVDVTNFPRKWSSIGSNSSGPRYRRMSAVPPPLNGPRPAPPSRMASDSSTKNWGYGHRKMSSTERTVEASPIYGTPHFDYGTLDHNRHSISPIEASPPGSGGHDQMATTWI